MFICETCLKRKYDNEAIAFSFGKCDDCNDVARCADIPSKYLTPKKYVELSNVDAFIKEIEEVCRKHDMSISHEDGHGAFIIELYDEYNIEWLKSATIAKYREN